MKKIENLFGMTLRSPTLCVYFFYIDYLVGNYMYLQTFFYNRSLIETLVKFMAVKYNPSLISCNKVHS